MPDLNLYAAHALDRSQSSEQLAAALTAQLNSTDPRDALTRNRIETARTILGDPQRRGAYDAQLADPAAPAITEATLAALAGRPVPTGPALGSRRTKLIAASAAIVVAVIVIVVVAVAASGGGSSSGKDPVAAGPAGSATARPTTTTTADEHGGKPPTVADVQSGQARIEVVGTTDLSAQMASIGYTSDKANYYGSVNNPNHTGPYLATNPVFGPLEDDPQTLQLAWSDPPAPDVSIDHPEFDRRGSYDLRIDVSGSTPDVRSARHYDTTPTPTLIDSSKTITPQSSTLWVRVAEQDVDDLPSQAMAYDSSGNRSLKLIALTAPSADLPDCWALVPGSLSLFKCEMQWLR